MKNANSRAAVTSADFDSSKSVLAALARACELLEAGDLADAAKWAAIAAGLGEGETLAETA
jgi:hypothetical protein